MEASRYKTFAACARFDDELEAFLEGEARSFVVAHSRECVSCGALLADLQSIQQVAHELPLEEPSPTVWANVHARLEAEGVFAASPCLQFADELEGYMEGETHPFIFAHAQECAACGGVLADLESIRAAAHDLPLAEPPRRVWLRVREGLIADGLFAEPVSLWQQILAWRLIPEAIPLGVLALLVLVGTVLSLPSTRVQRWGGAGGPAKSPALTQIASAALASEDTSLAHVVSELESNFRANEASMAPDLKATYEKSLVSLDGSIQECLDSLRDEPRNTLAHDYLMTAYTRKAEILSSALEFEGR